MKRNTGQNWVKHVIYYIIFGHSADPSVRRFARLQRRSILEDWQDSESIS